MAMKFIEKKYASPKNILAIPDHFVAIGVKHEKASDSKLGIATKVDNRFIVKAGTFYPRNDATAIGVVLQDYDVTEGDVQMAIVIHGFIKKAALPTEPNSAVKLPQITFLDKITE